MCTRYVIIAGEIGKGAGDAQDAGVTAGGEAEFFAGVGEELLAGCIWGGVGGEVFAVCFGVGAGGGAGVAFGLALAGGGDAGGDLTAGFGFGGAVQVGGAERGDVYVEIYPVQQWPGQAGLVIGGAARRAGAGAAGITKMAAAAGVHGGDELHAGGIGDVGGGAGNGDRAAFQRLA